MKILLASPLLLLGPSAPAPSPSELASAPGESLSRALPSQDPVELVYGVSPQQYFGSSVTSFSDFDGDGLEDFAVAVPCDNQSGPHPRPLSGSVKIYSGFPSIERLNLEGEIAGDLFGSSIARIPDLDCDGIDELLVGAPGACLHGRASGRAYVYSGADAHIIFYLSGEVQGEEFGASVCAVGDLDHDGTSEFAVGSPGARTFGRNSGLVRVFDGADAHVVFRLYGDEFGERFGTSLAGAGDMDGDGTPEIVVGAPCPRLARPGYVRIFSGTDAEILYTVGGQHTWELFGTSVAALGDIDGDARADFLVGAPASRSGDKDLSAARDHACGAATLFSGGTGEPLFTFASDESEDRLGTSLALGPDLDGDGVRDLLIGASQRWRARAGYVRAYGSRSGGLITTFVGVNAGEQFGAACAVLESTKGQRLLAVGSPTDAARGAGRISLIELEPKQR